MVGDERRNDSPFCCYEIIRYFPSDNGTTTGEQHYKHWIYPLHVGLEVMIANAALTCTIYGDEKNIHIYFMISSSYLLD